MCCVNFEECVISSLTDSVVISLDGVNSRKAARVQWPPDNVGLEFYFIFNGLREVRGI